MDTNFNYPKGSLWRQWDLQVQSILDDEYVSLDEYAEELKQNDLAKWQAYIAKVGGQENALLFDSKDYFNDLTIDKRERCLNYVRNFFAFIEIFNPELGCIGLTDHNYFDDLLLDVFIEYAKNTQVKVIPGVEINCGGVHLLIYFSRQLYGKQTFSAGIHAFLMKFNIDNRTTGGVLTTTTADIKAVINEVQKHDGIVIYPHCNSDNGLFQERSRTDRTHLADVFNHQKMNLLQSRHYDSCTGLEAYIRSNPALKSKFCTHISSDARALRDCGAPDKKGNYLWIKSDPTYEGLRQIVHEPQQRIFVGAQKPGSKKSYFVIDKVRFLDNAADQKFGSDAIEINKNMTTIIGGKSTGKSLLLYYIAKTVDATEVNDRLAAARVPISYDFDADPNFNFEVVWEDGQKTMLRAPEGALEEAFGRRKILYIPQKYLNTLSEANIKSREALNDFVLRVILQDSITAQGYDNTIREIRALTKSIQFDAGQLFSDQSDIHKMEEDLKRFGDEQGIQNYINSLQIEADSIKTKSGLTDGQIKEYEIQVAKEKLISTKMAELEADRKTVRSFSSSISSQVGNVQSIADEHEAYLNDDQIKAKFKLELKVIEGFTRSVEVAIANISTEIEEKSKAYNSDMLTIKSGLAPLLSKMLLQADLESKTKAIVCEQQKLNDVVMLKNGLKIKKEAYAKKVTAIFESYKKIFSLYEDIRNEMKKFESKFGEIKLGVHVSFNDEAFNLEVVKEYLNKVDLKRVINEAEWGHEFVYQYDPMIHLSNIEKVFGALLNGKINTLRGRTVRDAVTKLFNDYFYIDFRIFFKNDSLDKMSPGKRGLVLLQLLVNLSNEEWPILLDQPEDDLDNRSVYEELVVFLREKKLRRQIIIVTHNPNLVVGADAEEVIVANQSGQVVARENQKYRFEYVSGSLENTFEFRSSETSPILMQKGIREHVCEILEGGKEAFQKREQKYSLAQI
jgi:predicted ATPase